MGGEGELGRARFGARLAAAVAARGPLCVGVDPHPGLLSAWGLPVDALGYNGSRTLVWTRWAVRSLPLAGGLGINWAFTAPMRRAPPWT